MHLKYFVGTLLVITIFRTYKYFIHRKEKANVRQIIQVTLSDNPHANFETLFAKVREYEMHVTRHYLRKILRQLQAEKMIVSMPSESPLTRPQPTVPQRLPAT